MDVLPPPCERYTRWRNAPLASLPPALAIQLIAVAPPRLLPSLGIVDTGVLYGQSVYATMSPSQAGQLAMPSSMLAGPCLSALGVPQHNLRWRWLGAAHAVATFYVVAVTGNHYWLDGIVAILVLLLVLVINDLGAKWLTRVRRHRSS
ncbi:MAG: phosphatase PAP2 family protein [Acidimicrobiales bacterium]